MTSLLEQKQQEYTPPVADLLTLGDVRGQSGWRDYLADGFTLAHVPELIAMIEDDDIYYADSDLPIVWSAIHAWRTLGQLKAETAIEALVELLPRANLHDDWIPEEIPQVLGMIGPKALPALQEFFGKYPFSEWAYTAASHAVKIIGEKYYVARPKAINILIEKLEHFTENDPYVNASLISDLIDLKGLEALPLIEQAFNANVVDTAIGGDWEDVQIELGLLLERHTPRQPTEFSKMREDFLKAQLDQLAMPESEEVDKEENQEQPKKKRKRKRKRKKK